MEFGYITKKRAKLSSIGETYIEKVKAYLDTQVVVPLSK